jgi:hypothetical protein
MPTFIANEFANAYSETLMVAVVITLGGTFLGLMLRRNLAAQAAVVHEQVQPAASTLEMAG